jgi:hypothetical protein
LKAAVEGMTRIVEGMTRIMEGMTRIDMTVINKAG